MQNRVWYAGKCIRKHEHGQVVQVAVIAQLSDERWAPVESWEARYKAEPVVELMSPHAKSLKPSEWVAFQLSGQAKNKKLWQVQEYRRLYRYVDLSNVGGPEEIHRLLIGGTRLDYPAGGLAVRAAGDKILQIEMRHSNNLAQLGNPTVRQYAFDPAAVLAMPDSAGKVELYDLLNASIIDVHDWSSDEAFATRIVKALADAADPRIGQVIEWLENHANRREALLSLDSRDLTAATHALRSGELAKRLSADKALLESFTDALLSDERIAALMSNTVERIAEKERARVKAKAEADVQREVESQRRRALSALEAEIDREGKTRRAAAEAQHAQRLHELASALASQRSEGEEQIREALEVRRTGLQTDIRELEGRIALDEARLAALHRQEEEARRQLESIIDEENRSRESLAGIRAQCVAAQAELAALKAERLMASQKCPVPMAPVAPGTPWTIADAGREISQCPCLTAVGRQLMKQFLALCLGGEIPLLCGPDVNDFLLVAELLLTNGTSSRMQGDPTVITFEDLWVRPGTEVPTALGQALAVAAGTQSAARTTLGVIEGADRSGARFWYPDLLRRSQGGMLPRRLILCATLFDDESEEAVELLSQAPRLVVSGAIDPASVVAIVKRLSAGTFGELEPGERSVDLMPFTSEVLGIAAINKWGASQVLRSLRVVAEAKRLSLSDTGALLQLLIAEKGAATEKTLISHGAR